MPSSLPHNHDPLRAWTRDRFATDSQSLARQLLGHLLVRRLEDGTALAGRIVETEAYIGVKDQASHAFGGRRTPRNEAMYGPPGTAYVYFTYGMHFCFNVVCGNTNDPIAVLIRALEPVLGIEAMTAHRAAASKARDPRFAPADLCRGPARLCQALGITRQLNGLDLVTDRRLFVADSHPLDSPTSCPAADKDVVRAPRVGVDYAGAWATRRLRWLIAGHPCVSVPPGRGKPAASPRVRRPRTISTS
jgi:DNA-3-methyladenine glycosylase